MKQEALSYFTDIHFTLFALILFIITFSGIVYWVFRKSAKKHFDEMAALPITEGESHDK